MFKQLNAEKTVNPRPCKCSPNYSNQLGNLIDSLSAVMMKQSCLVLEHWNIRVLLLARMPEKKTLVIYINFVYAIYWAHPAYYVLAE